jgi:predicted nuclease with TOPRIM domain
MDFRQFATTEASALVERLAAAMATDIEATTKQIQAGADVALAEVAAEVKQMTSELTKARTNEQTLLATIDEVRAEAKGLRTTLDDSRAETQALRSALEETRAGEKAARSAIHKMEADQTKHRETLEVAVQKVRDRCAAIQVELEKVTAPKAVADA